MADAYGVIFFAQSSDCEYNIDEMLDTLKDFSWGNEWGDWTREGDYLAYGQDQYPSVFPKRTVSITVEDADGTERIIDIVDATEDDFDNKVDSDEEDVTLGQLSKAISEHIREGWVEIAAIANEKLRYAYYQSLRVYATGDAIRKDVTTSTYKGGTSTRTETYDARTDKYDFTIVE